MSKKILRKHLADLKKAFDQEAKKADPMDLADIAKCYLEGVGVERDVPKAISYLQKVAKKKETTAISLLG